MLALTCALVLFAQDPGSPPQWVLAGNDGARASHVVVEGTIELSRAQAEAAAVQQARSAQHQRCVARGEEIVAASRPFWLPPFFTRSALSEWVAQVDNQSLDVIGRHTTVREYSYGESFQTSLLLGERSDAPPRRAVSALQHRVREAGKLFLAKSGGIAVFWALLAFLTAWCDRLSRGYMTWRLRLLALGLGMSVTPIVLLI